MAESDFIHLRVHSAYSLAEGAIKPPALAELCVKHQMPAVAITDTNNLFGSLELSDLLSSKGIQPIIGVVVAVRVEEEEGQFSTGKPIFDQCLLLAKNAQGYHHLLKLVSQAFIEVDAKEEPHISLEKLYAQKEGLIVFAGGPGDRLRRLLVNSQKKEAKQYIEELYKQFGDNLYIELTRTGDREEEQCEDALLAFADEFNIPLVATNDVYFSDRQMSEAHDALLCVAAGRYLTETDRRKITAEHYYKSSQEMQELFEDIPEAISNTKIIAKRCAVMSPGRDPILPSYPTEEGRNEEEELRHLAKQGLEKRLETYVLPPEKKEGLSAEEQEAILKPYHDRLQFELDVIAKMQYPGYFLIVSDFIRWSKRHNIPVGPGRGSGAGSLVAWSLEITDLNPLRFGLLFERFLNPERVSMPDFDVDFCQEKRDQVISYVQDRYGEDKVAQIITFGKLQARAVLRDVGRVMQMPYNQVDKICKLVPNNPANPVTLAEAIEMEDELQKARDEDEQVAQLIGTALKLEGLYRHASTHAAGVVIGDRPLDELVPLYRDPKSDMPVTGYSMKYAEKSGLVKFDFLGLKTLTVIDYACQFINADKSEDEQVDISKISLEDPATFEMFGTGDSIGVFQLESAGMRDTLRKMKPDKFEDIIALISLYRPGPMENIPSYIARKQGTEKPDYLHPKLKDILEETYGVIIYQEQVMQIAQVLSGYSLGSADLLRRAMGKKIKAEMDAQREMFVDGAVKNDVEKVRADYIFDLVAKFAGYGFNKSHAAAYALISYQTAWLKANYPVQFLAASMNLDINDTDKLLMFKQEADRMDIAVLPPDVNASQALFTVEKTDDGLAIRFGLGALKNVGIQAMESVVAEREANGAFKDLFEFAGRVNSQSMNKRQLENLSRAGAFDSIHPNRHQLVEGVELITRYIAMATQERSSNQISLFGGDSESAVPTPALPNVKEWNNYDKLQEEFAAVGFFLSAHPLDGYKTALDKMGITYAEHIVHKVSVDRVRLQLAGIVTSVKVRISPRGKYAFVQLSDPTGTFEVSIFDEMMLNANRELLESGSGLLIKAEGRKDEGGIRMLADFIQPLDQAVTKQQSSLHITLDKLDNLSECKQIIESAGKGRTSVKLHVPIAEYQVQLALPSGYTIPPHSKDEISSIDGVVLVEEQ